MSTRQGKERKNVNIESAGFWVWFWFFNSGCLGCNLFLKVWAMKTIREWGLGIVDGDGGLSTREALITHILLFDKSGQFWEVGHD